MSSKDEQLDKGVMRSCISLRERRHKKKTHRRLKRRELKDMDVEPRYNRYKGWST